MLLVSLIGEQQLPNYLPIIHLKPQRVLLIHSAKTAKQAERLKNVLVARLSDIEVRNIRIHPYLLHEDFEAIHKQLLGEADVLFNITGGTKIMSNAAVLLASQLGSDCIYYQSEGNLSRLYWYAIENNTPRPKNDEDLPENLFTIEDYLKLYLGDYRCEGYHKDENGQLDEGGRFEQAVGETLKQAGFEVLAGIRPAGEGNQLEIDLIFRLHNQMGIAEIKVGDAKGDSVKKGIDQLTTAGEREYLGTYVKRFLVTARNIKTQQKKYAYAHGVYLIELPVYSNLTPNQKGAHWQKMLTQEVKEYMSSTRR